MKKFAFLLSFLLLATCVQYTPRFAPENVIARVRAHTVSIATYYVMDDNTYNMFMAVPSHMIRVPATTTGQDKAVAIIGSGTIIRDNHVISVRHMFDDHYGIPPTQIYVFISGWDHAVEADIVCKSEIGNFWDDYSVIKLREDTGLPGIRIGDTQPLPGDKVINTGSPGGFAFFTRYSRISELQYYFKRGEDDRLYLSPWENFPYMVIKGGGPGDSGGSICNLKGELCGLMYCGLENYSEHYIFANPLFMLHEWLDKNHLNHLK